MYPDDIFCGRKRMKNRHKIQAENDLVEVVDNETTDGPQGFN